MNKWTFLALGLVICSLIASASAAPIVDNNEIYIWGDPFGDRYDNYAEVAPGETIQLEIWVNDLDGSYDMTVLPPDNQLVNETWQRAADGAVTAIWWDPVVVDGPSVHEDKLTGQDPTTYYSSYWQWTWGNTHLAHYWEKEYYENGAVRWVAESKHVINMSITIREDAPVGPTKIGLDQLFMWGSFAFFRDRIEIDDPYAMTLMVLGGQLGDFDGDGDVDTDDIDLLCDNLGDAAYDLDGDGDADEDDMIYLVENLVELTDGSGRTGTQVGDFNLDGLINATDLAIMSPNFGTTGMNYGAGNANCDDLINATDLAVLAGNFGYIAPAGAVPEPATMSLLAVGGLALARRRRRLL
ncbi:MAG: PEP-CTERM sorting domain-containing protein [Planctomycetota bacterium]|jgi:hypothetical protein